MSSVLSGGGGRAYGFDLDLVKSSSPSPRSSHSSSSPSSTLSESSNSPRAISTKKARTPRKRPNQTSTEAAALLAKIYPNIFSTKNLRKHCKLSRPYEFAVDSSDLLPPFPGLADAGFLLSRTLPEEPNSLFEPITVNSLAKSCWSPPRIGYQEPGTSSLEDDFDAESMLDEEVGEGIDSIMGNLSVDTGEVEEPLNYAAQINPYLGHPMGFGYGGAPGNMTRALRNVGDGDWWCSPTVEIQNIVPELKPSPAPEKKKKKKKVEKIMKGEKGGDAKEEKGEESKGGESASSSTLSSSAPVNLKPALSLNLNYEVVLKEWSGSPFSEGADTLESPADIIARISDIDLLSEVAGSGGIREASVLRYKEKRRSRLFAKKIRYQVRKANADRRPRMKASSGRFVKTDDE